MFDLTGRNAVVTGASAGLGREIALALAGQGANVAILARRENKLEEVAAEIRALGVDCLVVKCDVTINAQVEAAAAKCIAHFGKVDILVNNAGITRDGLMLRMPEADWDAVLDTNLKGAFCCCKAAYRPMMRQRYGRIINMSSVVGLRGNAGQANYSASKAGLIGLTLSLIHI